MGMTIRGYVGYGWIDMSLLGLGWLALVRTGSAGVGKDWAETCGKR